MPNSLFTAVSGLLAHQRRLDIVANNLANLNTTAYKTNRGVFSDLFYETVTSASTGNGLSIGGTNPSQLGTGVKVAQIKKLFSQGNLESTGQPLDFALDGEGFFVLNAGGATVFTRAGSFSLDADNYLVDPSTGAYVQRFGTLGESGSSAATNFQVAGDTRIHVPIGSVIPGQPTTDIAFDGLLNSEAIGPLTQILTSSTPFESLGSPATAGTLLNALDTNTVDYVGGDSLDITGTLEDGTPVSTTLAVDGTTTLGDVQSAIDALLPNATVTLDASGNMVITANATGLSEFSLDIADSAGNTGSTSFVANRFLETQSGKSGDTFSGVFEVFDPQGAAYDLNFEFEKQGTNLWDLSLTIDPASGVIAGGSITNILFNDDGTLHTSVNANPDISITFAGFANPQSIDFSFSTIRQLATEFEILPTQDGFAPSDLVSTSIDTDGVVQGLTANGQVLPLARLAVATFSNKNGLNAVGGNYFTNTLNSGTAQIGSALNGGRGAIRGGQLEASNVDTAFEFTQLIVAQRGFSANARTISVADEVLEELTNIIR